MATIPINLDDATVRRLDTLVSLGIYKNRTEAIRDQIIKGLALIETVVFPEKSSKYNKALQNMLEKSSPPNIIISPKSAVELVSEGRER